MLQSPTLRPYFEGAEILQETLEDAGMEAEDVSKVMGIVAGARGSVVTA